MGNTKSDMPAHGWMAEDFADSPVANLIEDDPWSDSQRDSRRATTNNLPIHAQSTTSDADATDDVDATTGDDSGPPTTLTQANRVSDVSDDYAEPDSTEDDLSSYELEGDELETDLLLTLDELEDEAEFFDEPEPYAEYDSELADALYEPTDAIEVSALEIRLDQFISGVRLAESEQLDEIRSILSNFSSPRLFNWLKWLETKEWDTHDLLLFLEFRELWDSNPDWWERWTWIRRLGPRTTHTNASVLNRDSTYDLIQLRLEYESDEVIDPTWFNEWDYYAMWKHGFYSFASFAMFRAQIKDGEDWKRLVTWNRYDGLSVEWIYSTAGNQFKGGEAKYIIDQSVGRIYIREDDIPYRTCVGGPPLWFAVQDWYDTAEWHDNLGWAIDSIEMTHPYFSS